MGFPIPKPYYLIGGISVDEFLLGMLSLGTPIELSLVGVFDEKGRGSRRDIELDWHRDGDYNPTPEGKPDYVGFYCIRVDPKKVCHTKVRFQGDERTFALRLGQALVLDNRAVEHARAGEVGSRVLIRVWIKASEVPATVVAPTRGKVLAHQYQGGPTEEHCNWKDPSRNNFPCWRRIEHHVHQTLVEVDDA